MSQIDKDIIIIEAFLNNNKFEKIASESWTDLVKNYVLSHVKPGEEISSVLALLAPGAIGVMFSALGPGFGLIGKLLVLLTGVFNVNVQQIFHKIYEAIKANVTSGKKLTKSDIDSIVDSSVGEQKDAEEVKKEGSLEQQLRQNELFKIAMFESNQLQKQAFMGSKKTLALDIFKKFLKTFFFVVLGSVSGILAGDVINKAVGRPNAIDKSLDRGTPTETSISTPVVTSKQSVFKLNPTYSNTIKNTSSHAWSERCLNEYNAISNLIIDFAKDVYDDLDDKDNLIKSLHSFKAVVSQIELYNESAAGAPIVFIPKMYKTEKDVVDTFIDQLADKVKGMK